MIDAGRWIAVALLAAIVSACSSPHTAPTPPPATSTALPTTLSRLPTSQRAIALMFDLGDDAGHTAEILGVLRREDVRATFIVTGYWAEQHHDLLLAMTAAGHEIINGTYHGTSFTGASTQAPPLTSAERTLELSRTEVTVYHLSERSTRPYWHPPHGDIDAAAQQDAAAAGYPITVVPTFDTAASHAAAPDAVAARTIAAAASGAIILMHAASASKDSGALLEIVKGLRAAGYVFATIADVASAQ
jgi:peptidoglycan/xylan/chitin deacetylase (PgdA/CDA1 family)